MSENELESADVGLAMLLAQRIATIQALGLIFSRLAPEVAEMWTNDVSRLQMNFDLGDGDLNRKLTVENAARQQLVSIYRDAIDVGNHHRGRKLDS